MPATSADHALQLDAADPLAHFRDQFHIPTAPDGSPTTYLCGNSLGCMPTAVPDAINRELNAWKDRAVDGHFESNATGDKGGGGGTSSTPPSATPSHDSSAPSHARSSR